MEIPVSPRKVAAGTIAHATAMLSELHPAKVNTPLQPDNAGNATVNKSKDITFS